MFDSQVRRISEHIYAMNAGQPDRPSLCAIVGASRTLMLDSGASDEHARLFLDGLTAHSVRPPDDVALTHWHWDHVFGAAEIGATLIASQLTAKMLAVMGAQAWDDASLDARVASGEEIAFCADNIKLELPEPRRVRIKQPEIIFDDRRDIDLGGVLCHIRQVGGDHAADSCVVHIPADRLLFLGDCLYDDIYAPTRHYTRAKTLPLIETLLNFDADIYVEGHNPDRLDRAGFEALTAKMRAASDAVEQFHGDTDAIKTAMPDESADEDFAYFVGAFAAGYGH